MKTIFFATASFCAAGLLAAVAFATSTRADPRPATDQRDPHAASLFRTSSSPARVLRLSGS
jgi:hypothetical protein